MKIKNIWKISSFENKKAYLQYLLMMSDISKIQKTLDSLGNPVSVNEIIKIAKDKIEKKNKGLIKNISNKDIDKILLSLLLNAFEKNVSFDDELDKFPQHIASLSAKIKVETGMIIVQYANGVYKPETNDT